MRTLIPSSALVTAVTASLLLAPSSYATPKGDNGTVKIHDTTTSEELRKNEPKVCSFYLDAFGFDAAQKVDWHIEAWANNALPKGETVKSGSLTLDGSGHERTEDMTLPDGQYKLFWNFEGENGKAKHKVFKTDCLDGDKPGEGEGKPGDTPGEETQKPSAAPAPAGEEPNGGASPAESAAAAPAPSGQGDASGDLAETGSGAPVGALSAAAAALLGVGGYLVMRRRKAQQN